MNFTPAPKARTSFAKGATYVVCIDDNLFYCQVAFDKTFAFFRLISKEVLNINEILSRNCISLPFPKYGLRNGIYEKVQRRQDKGSSSSQTS